MTVDSYILALDWDENGNIQANSFAKPTYYYNDKWQVLCDYNDSNDLQMWFTYGNYIDEVLTANEDFPGSGYRYYVHDHLYSPVALMNYSGAVQERYEYDAYGNCYILEPNFAPDPDGKSDYENPYLFTGRRVDILDNGSLKIQYNRNRYYDQYTGRWLTHDPLGITPNPQKRNLFRPTREYADGMNLYEYVTSAPTSNWDPMGNLLEPVAKAVIVCANTDVLWRWHQVKLAADKLLSKPACVLTVFSGGGHPHEHCVWSCRMAKRFGKEEAKKCGRLKEDLDWAIADLADAFSSSCWNNELGPGLRKLLAAWTCSAFQASDFRDNAAGRDCGTNSCLTCWYWKCADCCAKDKGIGPGTPEGDSVRPWGPRCTGRYLALMPP